MCKYKMDLANIVTERTRFCPRTEGQTDGRRETSIPPFNFFEPGDIVIPFVTKQCTTEWLNARLQYLQCYYTKETAALHLNTEMSLMGCALHVTDQLQRCVGG